MPRAGRKRKEHRISQDGIEEKNCHKCDTWKPLNMYYKHSKARDKLQPLCKTCHNSASRKRHLDSMKTEEGRERRRAIQRRNHNKRQLNGKRNAYQRKRRKEDHAYRTKAYIRSRIWHCFNKNGVKKTAKTSEIMGCSPEFLNAHFEKYFTDDMSWENRNEWHIDHVVPCCAFGPSIEEQKILHWYGNLRPMFASENCSKGGRYNEEDKIALIKRYNKENNTNYMQAELN